MKPIFLQLKIKQITMNSKMMLPIELTKILYQSWQGQVSISSQDSQIYGKCLNGPGKVTFKNGNEYDGNFYNGLLHGSGKFTWSNGIIYEGQFTENRITGKGNYKWPDASLYEGDVKDGLRHGWGKYTIDQATYEGDWLNGKKQGKGKIIYKSGSIFEGEFKSDFKEGFGKMYYYPSGNFFEGQWKNDVKQGKGTMNWTDIRQKYVGQWKSNHQEGWGVHIWLQSKGEGKYLRNRYEGNWKKGQRQGFGVFYYANGSKYQGYWKENMKQGYAFYTNESGKVSQILFNKDRMIKSSQPSILQAQNTKKTPSKKEVQPNYYSLCLNIEHFYEPHTPNLEFLFNFLLRNNTQLKTWYKSASTFYEQQSQYSFSLNLEGTWKMIRSLKILGNLSLAAFNRGLRQPNPDVEKLMAIIKQQPEQYISYEDIFFKNLSSCKEDVDLLKLENVGCQSKQQYPLNLQNIHNRQRNILFRQFVHLMIWMGHNLDPNVDNPQKSIEKLTVKITPFLDQIGKSLKSTASQGASQNKSSVSKAQKNLTPFFKTTNGELMNYLNQGKNNQLITINDQTIRIRELIGYGMVNGCIGESQFALLQKILEKYMDSQYLAKQVSQNWKNSCLSSKIINLINYQLIPFEFIEVIYILFIKKLPSHKETEQNKKKYQQCIQELYKAKDTHEEQVKKEQQYCNEARYFISKKKATKQKMQQKRIKMEETKAKLQFKQKEKEREKKELQLMRIEDIDIKNSDQFQEEQSQFEI